MSILPKTHRHAISSSAGYPSHAFAYAGVIASVHSLALYSGLMGEKHTSLPSLSSPERPTRPHLTKHALAARHDREGALSPTTSTPLSTQSKSFPSNSFASGSGSSSSKPLFSFRDDYYNSSSLSETQSPDSAAETPPKLVQSPRPSCLAIYPEPDQDHDSCVATSLQSGELSELPPPHTSPPSGGPTRASIRAWAEATPAGPPKGPSSRKTPVYLQPAPDDSSSRSCVSFAADDVSSRSGSSVQHSSGRSGDQASRLSLNGDETSGNIADRDDSHDSLSPPHRSPSPAVLQPTAQHEPTNLHSRPRSSELPSHSGHIAPAHSHPKTLRAKDISIAGVPQETYSYAHSCPSTDSRSRRNSKALPSASAIPSPTVVTPAAASLDKQRHDRGRHHHTHEHHRRYKGPRDRDYQHEQGSRSPSLPAYQVVSVPALRPLPPLRPPPPPLPLSSLRTPSLRHAPAPHERPDAGMFEDIEKLLKMSRKPVLRATRDTDCIDGSDGGWLPFPAGLPSASSSSSRSSRREGDVLEDIRRLIRLSRGR